jgi:hypothetical protein
MNQALKEGYTITHKGLLLSSPLPAAIDVARFRLLYVAMEVAFSFHFWTMNSRLKDYGIGDCCPWALDQFTYQRSVQPQRSARRRPWRFRPYA